MSTLPAKETLKVEFKSDRKSLPDSEIVLAAICLANTEGGHLYLGVENDGTVTGATTPHQDTHRLAAMIANMTSPGEEGRGASAPVAPPVPPLTEKRPRRSVQRIPVELPQYAFEDIKRRALEHRCSARHVIMKALRAYGVHIDDEDMPEDGRRLR